MAPISEVIRQFAEEPDEFVAEPLPPARRVRTPSFSLLLSPSPTLSFVKSVSTSESALDDTIAEVRRLVADAGYTRVAWYVGPSCRPVGLAALLAARGFVPATRPPLEPEAIAMALVAPPPLPSPATGLEARVPRDFDEYLEVIGVAVKAFEMSQADADGWRAAAAALWTQQDGVKQFTHLALVDGRTVGFAFAATGASGLFLCGSGVLSDARGRGAYKALVAARWAEAVRLGKPALVVQAGAMSRPILERCGFQTICRLDVLDDPAVGPAGSPLGA